MAILAKTQKWYEGKSERGGGCNNSSPLLRERVKVLDLYNFIRGFGWAYKRGGGLISGWAYKWNKKNGTERRNKTHLRNDLKLTYHYVLSYIYNTFIVRCNKRRIYFKNVYKTDLCDCLTGLKRNAKGTLLYSRWAYKRGGGLYPGGLISGIKYLLANEYGLYPGGLKTGGLNPRSLLEKIVTRSLEGGGVNRTPPLSTFDTIHPIDLKFGTYSNLNL